LKELVNSQPASQPAIEGEGGWLYPRKKGAKWLKME
jgi:hypothetical protein